MKKNKSIFAPIISGIYKKICCMKTGTIKNNKKLQVTKSEFVNDYLTDEEQEMFRKRAIPNGAHWRGGILGYEGCDDVRCTIDRENHVYLFNIEKHHDAEDLDVENFKLVWDYLGKNKGIAFTMKREFVGEYKFGIGNDIVWNNFNLYLSDELYPKREIIVDKIKEAMRTYGLGGRAGTIPRYKIEFDF